MKNKFLFLTKQSLNKKIKSKWFLAVNIIFLIGIVALINIDSIISFFGGDFNKEKNIIVVDSVDEIDTYEIFKANMDSTNKLANLDTKYKVSKTDNYDKAKKHLAKKDILINLSDSENFLQASITSLEKIDTSFYQLILSALNNTKKSVGVYKSDIDEEKYAMIESNIAITREVINEEKGVDENLDLIMNTVFPIVILPFFMLSVFLVQMIGSEINEEKSTRSMEIIISNVSPGVHFASKIVGSNLYVIIQGILLIVYVLLGLLIRGNLNMSASNSIFDINMVIETLKTTGFIDKLTYIVPLTIILMILTFIAYSLTSGILASMTTNAEDFNQIQTPLAIICIVGYYLSIISPMFNGSILIRILSYVPFIGGILSPALLMMGEIGVCDMIISILVLLISILLLIKFGMRIYKVGILNYSSSKLWSKMGHSLKNNN